MIPNDSVLTRREFIWKSGQLTLLGTAGAMLAACHPDAATFLEPSAGEPRLRLATARFGGPHQISITGPRSLLRFGDTVKITGTLKDSRGRPLVNTTIGVSDGLRMLSTTTRTDKDGKLAYATVVNAKGAAIVEFVIDGYRYPYAFQSRNSRSPYYAASALFSAIAIRNATKKTLTARVKDSRGRTYKYSIPKNSTKCVVSVKKSAPNRVTAYAGVTTSATLGEASATVDTNGVATVTVTGGQFLLRGSVYGTTAGDLGLCWAPGAQGGAGPVEISGEVAVCVGTDGGSIGVGGSLGGAAGGFSVEIF